MLQREYAITMEFTELLKRVLTKQKPRNAPQNATKRAAIRLCCNATDVNNTK